MEKEPNGKYKVTVRKMDGGRDNTGGNRQRIRNTKLGKKGIRTKSRAKGRTHRSEKGLWLSQVQKNKTAIKVGPNPVKGRTSELRTFAKATTLKERLERFKGARLQKG